MTHPVLDVRTVSRRYGDRPAVTDASFTLTAGGVACLLGPSGCGKSTLLRMIAGLEPVDGGEIHLGGTIASQPGRAIAPEDRGVGLVFQDFALFPHLNVTDNIGFGLRGRPSAARAERVAAMLARFHIEHLAHAWPHTLSGGEQQRVAIARALARDPALVLLDEPFSGLDGQLRAEVRAAVLADLRATGTSVLIVTHDPREAMQVADHLILMSHGQILQTGSPQDCYRAPVSVGAARLLGDALVFPAQIRAGVTQCVIGTFDAGGAGRRPRRADGAPRRPCPAREVPHSRRGDRHPVFRGRNRCDGTDRRDPLHALGTGRRPAIRAAGWDCGRSEAGAHLSLSLRRSATFLRRQGAPLFRIVRGTFVRSARATSH
ncbi:ABC transporter ATP-binding protein [Sphingomonas sp. J315]|nr:ABC transporter ATP-binding protein [Sphingomonas sp. J315]UUY00948.1 ABC transporter ATP-binding protein [Sphingomonas sp. J315]